MLESKLIWMYFQSNSIPLAPTHKGRHLHNPNKTQIQCLDMYNNLIKWSWCFFYTIRVIVYLDMTSSAVAQPMAATMILYSPLPALRDMTRWRPNRSARSTVDFINSWRICTSIFQPPSQTGILCCCFFCFVKSVRKVQFNTHPYKVIHSSSSFPCGEKCS